MSVRTETSGTQAAAAALVGADRPGITASAATSPEDREAIKRLIHHYAALVEEVHLPHLDSLVLDKYVVQPLSAFMEDEALPEDTTDEHHNATASSVSSHVPEGRIPHVFLTVQEAKIARDHALQRMVTLVTAVSQHKQKTLEVLEAVLKRDEAWKRLVGTLRSCSVAGDAVSHPTPSGDAATVVSVSVESAALVQHAVYVVQRATLQVIERIVAWREGLSMPHPFMVGTENYLLRIINDTAFLATSRELESILPMQSLFFKFPLCSNLPSLARFAQDPAKPQFSMRATQGYGPVADGPITKRLVAAERVLLDEVETQLNVIRQLLDLCRRHRFLPVLQLKKLYPQAFSSMNTNGQEVPSQNNTNSGGVHGSSAAHVGPGSSAIRGIPVQNAQLQQKLESVLLHQLDVLANPPFKEAYISATSGVAAKS